MFENTLNQVLSFVELGGPVVGLLLILSVVSLGIIIFKLWQFWYHGVGKNVAAIEAIVKWKASDNNTIPHELKIDNSVLGKLLRNALRFGKTHTREDFNEHFEVVAKRELKTLSSALRGLDSIAQVSPLIGLFGTVLGMIEAFRKLQDAGNSVDPSLLAGGIWVALLTTAVGLAVAMPSSLFLSYFESRLERLQLSMEETITAVINPVISSETSVQAVN